MTSWIIPLPFVLFELGKCGKEGKKLQKFEYLENEKSFLDEIKNLIKNSGHKVWFRYCNKFIWNWNHCVSKIQIQSLASLTVLFIIAWGGIGQESYKNTPTSKSYLTIMTVSGRQQQTSFPTSKFKTPTQFI